MIAEQRALYSFYTFIYLLLHYTLIFIGKVGDKTDGATVPDTGAECVAHNGWGSGIAVIVSIISNVHYNCCHFHCSFTRISYLNSTIINIWQHMLIRQQVIILCCFYYDTHKRYK